MPHCIKTYKVCWYDAGCCVFDGDYRLPFKGHRYTADELQGKSRAEVAKLPGALWRSFSRS